MLVLAVELPGVAHETVLELFQVLNLQCGLRVGQSGASWLREVQQF